MRTLCSHWYEWVSVQWLNCPFKNNLKPFWLLRNNLSSFCFLLQKHEDVLFFDWSAPKWWSYGCVDWTQAAVGRSQHHDNKLYWFCSVTSVGPTDSDSLQQNITRYLTQITIIGSWDNRHTLHTLTHYQENSGVAGGAWPQWTTLTI